METINENELSEKEVMKENLKWLKDDRELCYKEIASLKTRINNLEKFMKS